VYNSAVARTVPSLAVPPTIKTRLSSSSVAVPWLPHTPPDERGCSHCAARPLTTFIVPFGAAPAVQTNAQVRLIIHAVVAVPPDERVVLRMSPGGSRGRVGAAPGVQSLRRRSVPLREVQWMSASSVVSVFG
jgi:hypothetical protein